MVLQLEFNLFDRPETLSKSQAQDLVGRATLVFLVADQVGERIRAASGGEDVAVTDEEFARAAQLWMSRTPSYPTCLPFPCSEKDRQAFLSQCDDIWASEPSSLADAFLQMFTCQAAIQFILEVELHGHPAPDKLYVLRAAGAEAVTDVYTTKRARGDSAASQLSDQSAT